MFLKSWLNPFTSSYKIVRDLLYSSALWRLFLVVSRVITRERINKLNKKFSNYYNFFIYNSFNKFTYPKALYGGTKHRQWYLHEYTNNEFLYYGPI